MAFNYRGARSSILRGTLFALAGRHSKLLLAPFGKGALLVDASDMGISRMVFIRGNFDRNIMQAAVEFLGTSTTFPTRGTTFLDVGANIGTTTVDALMHFDFSDAVCFEPYSRNFRLLRMNLLLNDLEHRTSVFQMALSNRDGDAVLNRSPENFGDTRLGGVQNIPPKLGSNVETTQCARLDSLIDQGAFSLERVGLIWMDTQGHEGFVMEGAAGAMKAGIPVVLEYWPQALEANGSVGLLDGLIKANFKTAVDLRMLCHGLTSKAILPASEVDVIRNRYHGPEHTDLLLIPG